MVVANPPYMGSSNMNGWVSKWVKKNYPIAKSDLCTCFFNRAQQLAKDDGYISMITASSWMFISSFEKFRKELLSKGSICSMIQQSTHGYAGVTVPTTMFTYACHRMGVIGSYIRLEDFDRPQWQEPRALEALADPECGWFYRADADGFGAIPGSPIAYWASSSALGAFENAPAVSAFMNSCSGITTGDTRFVSYWHEVELCKIGFNCTTWQDMGKSTWFPLNSGGEFRLFYGNNEKIVNLYNGGEAIRASGGNYRLRDKTNYFKKGLTWGRITSSDIAFRSTAPGTLFGDAGPVGFTGEEHYYLLGFLTSALLRYFVNVLNPTLNCQIADIERVPLLIDEQKKEQVEVLVTDCIENEADDWNAVETSWDFKRHPLA